MSVRFDAATDRISYTGIADPPDITTGITVTFWVYLSVDRDTFSTMCRLWSDSFGTVATLTTDGTTGEVPVAVSPGNTGGIVSSETLAVGQWSKVGFTCTGSSGTLYVADTGATDVASGTVSSTGVTGGFTFGGRDPGDASEWFNGRMAQVRIWSSVLTQSEVEAEWASPTPVVTTNLWADYPLSTAADLTDHSGAARDLSAGSTAVTTEADPPNGAESVNGTLAGAGGGSGALTGLRRTHGTVAGSGGGTGQLSGLRRVHGTASGAGGGVGSLAGTPEAPGQVTGQMAGAGGGVGALVGRRARHGTASGSGGGVGALEGALGMWRLVLPTIRERYALPGTNGSLTVSNWREVTVFGDENGLFTADQGAASGGVDEYGAIPFGTKYIWYGGHVNITDDPAIKALWLAHGFEVENVSV